HFSCTYPSLFTRPSGDHTWLQANFLDSSSPSWGAKGCWLSRGVGLDSSQATAYWRGDGQAIPHFRAWDAILGRTQVGRPQGWEIARDDRRLQLEQTFDRGGWSDVHLEDRIWPDLGLLLEPQPRLLLAFPRVGRQRGVTCRCCLVLFFGFHKSAGS